MKSKEKTQERKGSWRSSWRISIFAQIRKNTIYPNSKHRNVNSNNPKSKFLEETKKDNIAPVVIEEKKEETEAVKEVSPPPSPSKDDSAATARKEAQDNAKRPRPIFKEANWIKASQEQARKVAAEKAAKKKIFFDRPTR